MKFLLSIAFILILTGCREQAKAAPMSEVPAPYTRKYDFTTFSAQNPTSQQPGNQMDAEWNDIKRLTDELLARLALIQRDDGRLANGIVTREALAAAFAAGVNAPVPWAINHAYVAEDSVLYSGSWYWALIAHTSTGTFDPTKWQYVGTFASDAALDLALGKEALVDGIFSADAAGRLKMEDSFVTEAKIDPAYRAKLTDIVQPIAFIAFNPQQASETYTFSYVGTTITATRVGSTNASVGDWIYFTGQTGNNTALNGSHKILTTPSSGVITFHVSSVPAGALASANAKLNAVQTQSDSIDTLLRLGTGHYYIGFSSAISPTERQIINLTGRNDGSIPGACVVSETGDYAPNPGTLKIQMMLIDGSSAVAYEPKSCYMIAFKHPAP